MNPTPRLVYLAEPIDRTKGAPAPVEVSEMASALSTWGANIFRPSTAFRCQTLDPRVDQINREVLYKADVLVAYLSLTVASVGVPMEIEAATSRGIPTVVLYGADSYALEANPLVTVIQRPSEVIPAIEKAVANRVQTLQRLEEAAAQPIRWLMGAGGETEPIKLVLADGHELPARAYPDDAGVDLTCVEQIVINPGEFKDVQSQVRHVQLPGGVWGMIIGRSSTIRKWGLHIPQAVIDPGWRGGLFVGVWNLTDKTVYVPPGTRLAQLICVPNRPLPLVAVDRVDDHERGLSGFGSSG